MCARVVLPLLQNSPIPSTPGSQAPDLGHLQSQLQLALQFQVSAHNTHTCTHTHARKHTCTHTHAYMYLTFTHIPHTHSDTERNTPATRKTSQCIHSARSAPPPPTPHVTPPDLQRRAEAESGLRRSAGVGEPKELTELKEQVHRLVQLSAESEQLAAEAKVLSVRAESRVSVYVCRVSVCVSCVYASCVCVFVSCVCHRLSYLHTLCCVCGDSTQCTHPPPAATNS